MNLEVVDLGRRPYPEVWELQKQMVERRASGSSQDSIILVEHEHVITLGRKTSPENFRPQSVPVFQVERGGDATYHGPGQLVGYPIIRMAVPDVRKFVRMLEDVLVLTAAAFSVSAERKEGHPGVWVGEKKLASIGVAVTNWVTYHGFALNVNTDLGYFHLIRPCGLEPETMTSMQELLGREVPMEPVKAELLRNFSSVFQVELVRPGLTTKIK
ncbi:MAG: lipoyl(octanoyl) transferase LipB [Nitrososphaerota archaeon]|nr:lipoyl(octanoyl) transferase LipB [Nitrososphaerota archaeon]